MYEQERLLPSSRASPTAVARRLYSATVARLVAVVSLAPDTSYNVDSTLRNEAKVALQRR